MNNLIKQTSLLFVPLAIMMMSGCLKDKFILPDQNPDDYNLVYMPQAVNKPDSVVLLMKSEAQHVIYGANYGGVGYAKEDISLNFKVSPDSVSSYNQKNGSDYPLMPAGSYTLENETAVIPKGSISTAPLKLNVKTEGVLDLFKEYLLPVTVSINHSGPTVKLNTNLATTYYIVKASLNLADFVDYDRSNWSVVSFSSEETTGEGAANGRANHAIDNKINTYWHTAYSNGLAPPPHNLVVNMKETKTIHGVSFTARQNENTGRPMQITLQTSTDGSTFTDAATFDLRSSNSKQRFFLRNGFKNAQFLKIIINKMYDGVSHTHLAEFAVF